ncbi:hypothetical protein Celaphus_00004823 [Cervus elaphus hippelaphus]|uniref:Uncharacterized protein n=1 Tax=Cervus elaphus hippelaphus TaxID=46360 RepID=A0A212DC49_CEREH|nr:hypothetical protein Celaphus_00004823 [Cervus elaphus hippelaphus]
MVLCPKYHTLEFGSCGPFSYLSARARTVTPAEAESGECRFQLSASPAAPLPERPRSLPGPGILESPPRS